MSQNDVRGSGKTVEIVSSTVAAEMLELVDQLNKSAVTVSLNLSASAGATARALLGTFRHPLYIKRVDVVNPQGNAFISASTDILVKHAALNDLNLSSVAGPASPTNILALEGFATGNLPANSNVFGDSFVAGTNVDAVSGKAKGAVVPKEKAVYVEFVNNEAAARSLEVVIHYCITDFIKLGPHGLQANPHRKSREFSRKDRGSADQ